MATGNYEFIGSLAGCPVSMQGLAGAQARVGLPFRPVLSAQRGHHLTNMSSEGTLAPPNRFAGLSMYGFGEAPNPLATPPGPARAWEDPSTWGSAVSSTLSATADLARAIRGEPPPDPASAYDTGVPAEEPGFLSTPAGAVTVVGGLAAAGIILYFVLRKSPEKAAKANRRRNRRRNRGRRS